MVTTHCIQILLHLFPEKEESQCHFNEDIQIHILMDYDDQSSMLNNSCLEAL
jgi:hypothetical protein